MKENNVGVKVIVPQIMLILAGCFLLELGLLSAFNQVLMEEGKFSETIPIPVLLYIAGMVLFGAAFLFLGTLFKRIRKKRLIIFIILSPLYLIFIGGFMYYFFIILPQQDIGVGEKGNNFNPIMNYIFYVFLLLIQIVPIIVIGFHIGWYEKKIKLTEPI